MKKQFLLLCVVILVGLFAACGVEEPDSSSEPSNVSESRQEQSSRSSSASAPVSDAASAKTPSQSASVPDPPPSSAAADAVLLIHVVDETGAPVKNVSGMLELGIATADSAPPALPLVGTGSSENRSGADGILRLVDKGATLPDAGTLVLHAYFDSSMAHRIPVQFSTAGKEISATWPGAAPPAKAEDPTRRRVTFQVVDKSGAPIANVSGGLEQSDGTTSSYRPLQGSVPDGIASGNDGVLYLELEAGWEKKQSNRAHQLVLQGYYDASLRETYSVELANPPVSYTITWNQPRPPAERPAQRTGLRLFVVDAQGNPVPGVELSGSPYPKEADEVPDIAMILGPSDQQGYIRWDDVSPGTYEMYGHKNGKSKKFEFVMPDNKAMADVTLTW